MGIGFYAGNKYKNFSIIDYNKLLSNIKDFFLLMKVIEYLETKILEEKYNEPIIIPLCTIVYTKEDLEKLNA